jgi:predicted enzyme related to lactoylglutathione lyase
MDLRFDCVCYYVRDLDRSIQFYSDVLRFGLESKDVVARFRVDGVLFELVPTDDEGKLSGRGNARLVLEVPDIQQAVRELAAQGVSVGSVVTVDNGWLSPFEDPDGNELVLWQYAKP